MGDEKLNEFEAPTYADWRKLAERDLEGAAFEKKLVKRVAGVDIAPLYTHDDRRPDPAGLPGFAPFARGSSTLGAVEMGWDVRQELAQGAPSAAAQAALEALNGGATSLTLRLDQATRVRGGEPGAEGTGVANLSDLERVLEHIPLDKVAVSIDAGGASLPLAAGLIALAARRKLPFSALSGCFGADPLGSLARDGDLGTSLDAALAQSAELAAWAAANAPLLRALRVDTSPYHEAGADAATEIAIALATGLAYLRALTVAGLSLATAASQLVFDFSIGRDFFVEIAKLRAARATWSKVIAACGGDERAQAMHIHARSSRRTKSQRDPWVNLLRGTSESFSAAVAGADAITTAGFDEPLGQSDEFGARLARNTQHLLRHEANLHRVVDPAGGSWYVESITDALARRAWEKLQALEREGGMAQVLLSGSIQRELAQQLEGERKAVETRKLAITGVNEFPHVQEAPLERPASDRARAAAHLRESVQQGKAAVADLTPSPGQALIAAIGAVERGASFVDLRDALAVGVPASVAPLARERLTKPFEALRDAADRSLAKRGKRPSVFLANLGPIPEHKARAGFAQNYLEAGGFATLSNDGFAGADSAAAAFAASGAEIAALCSSDAIYAELAVATAQALKAKGAKLVVLAGNPGASEAAYRAAGVDAFLYVGTNLVETLRSLLERVGAV